MPNASDIMNTTLLTLDANTTLGDAIKQLVEHCHSAAPVMQDGEMVGFVSELELFDVLFDPDLRHRPVSEVMETEMITVDESEPLGHVAYLFALHQIRRLPVLRAGTPVGVVSRRDLLKYASSCEQSLVDPLAELMPYMDEELAIAGPC